MSKTLTSDEMVVILREDAGDHFSFLTSTRDRVNEWLARGDGIAVYQNEDLGSRNVGARRFVSFGSHDAMIETDDPTRQMPGARGEITWRYQLEATYRGAPLVFVVDNPRDLRQTSKRSDLRDVVDLWWSATLDNHEPARSWGSGYAQEYSTDHGTRSIVLWDSEELRDADKCVFLIDDGDTVRPYYVSGHPADNESLWLKPFPTTIHACDECGIEFTEREEACDSCYSRKQRNGFRPIEFGTWSLGPRRAYHLKVRRG